MRLLEAHQWLLCVYCNRDAQGVSGLRHCVLRRCVAARGLPLHLVGVMLSSLLADFVCLCLPGPQQRLYRCQNNAGGRAMVCRDCCDHWQVVLMLFVMIIPKIDFSLFVVFSPALCAPALCAPWALCEIRTLPVKPCNRESWASSTTVLSHQVGRFTRWATFPHQIGQFLKTLKSNNNATKEDAKIFLILKRLQKI